MVGYGDPCPCCGHKRRLPALERWHSSPASFFAAAARSPRPAKFARSISSLSPSAAAAQSLRPIKFARSISSPSPSAAASAIATLAPLTPLAQALTPSDPPAPAPTENVVGAPLLPLPPDSFPDPAYPTTAIPAPAAAVSTPTEAVEIKVEVICRWGTAASVAVLLPSIRNAR